MSFRDRAVRRHHGEIPAIAIEFQNDPDDRDASSSPVSSAGPILFMRGVRDGRMALTAIVVRAEDAPAPRLDTADGEAAGRAIHQRDGRRVWRFAFELATRSGAWYAVDGERYEVNAALDGDLRVAFVSCNGQEFDDSGRERDERNAMWRRLARQHEEAPFHLLLQGGDQIYADELLDAHPAIRRWSEGDDTDADAGADVVDALRGAFFERYLELLAQPEIAGPMARIPSLAMWDDHDICDGWGSLRLDRLDAPVGRALFAVAREHFLMFQLGTAPDEVPEIAIEETGESLGWHVALPGLDVIAPDLRSERRPDRVMGEAGWRGLDAALGRVGGGRLLLVSSVPALGPRLSWVEAVLHVMPRMQKYEDDLRDQWQSRAHRHEWRDFLQRLAAVHADTPVTVLSGEIHLAGRATLDVPPAPLHQLVASGIAHPAPPEGYAATLGALARLGGSPLKGHPIRFHPLPGRPSIYTAQRNYLTLERRDGRWRAAWELEETGTTPPLDL